MLDLITTSSQQFSQQCPATNTSCYYQSRFLANVVAQYRRSKADQLRNSPGNERLRPWHQQHHLTQKEIYPPFSRSNSYYTERPSSLSQSSHNTDPSRSNSPGHYLHTPPSSASLPPPYLPSPLLSQHHLPNKQYHQNYSHPSSPLPLPYMTSSIDPANAPRSGPIQQQQNHNTRMPISTSTNPAYNNMPMKTVETHISHISTEAQNAASFPLFTDNMLWEDMFAHAGFNISSGAFLPGSEKKGGEHLNE